MRYKVMVRNGLAGFAVCTLRLCRNEAYFWNVKRSAVVMWEPRTHWFVGTAF